MATKLAKIVADFRTVLSVPVDVGGTSSNLQSVLDKDGVAIPDGTYFLTIDNENARKEFWVCTNTAGVITNIKNVSRQGVQTVGSAREHRVGASVKITDFASLLYMADLLTGTTALDATNPLKYDGTAAITLDEHLATKKYADDLAIAGAPDASTTVKGISEEATLAEDNAATGTGATGARLFVNPTTLAQSVMANRYGADAGSTDAYAIATPGVVPAYVAGQRYTFKANTANTGPATLAVDGLAATAIVKDVSLPLATGDIKAQQIVEVVYDGTNFQMISSTGPVPTGAVLPFHARTAPSGFLLADGTAYSRTTYAALFAVMFETIGTFTITLASPGVATLSGHGLATGDSVYLTTTGALPTGLAANTRYWVTVVDANTFKLATSLANALASTNINTSVSQSGTHTARLAPAGIGDGSTTFNVPDYKAKFLVGKDQSDSGFAGLGQTGGAKTATLTGTELPAHTHTLSGRVPISGSGQSHVQLTVASSGTDQAASEVTGSTGSGTAFSILNPYASVNFIIKV